MKRFIILPLAALTLSLSACDNNTQAVHEYHEIITAPYDMAQKTETQMPQDDIHAALVDPTQNMRDIAKNSPALQSQLDASVATTPLSWTTPQNWSETKGSGMRVVTFTTGTDAPTETTIIALNGSAGGVEGNIVRWARQINVSFDNSEEMNTFIAQQETMQTPENLDAQIVDFTLLTEESEQSMLAAIISTQTSQIFVKMTGLGQAITAEKDNFYTLIKSLETNQK